jgi:hypothetical protein
VLSIHFQLLSNFLVAFSNVDSHLVYNIVSYVERECPLRIIVHLVHFLISLYTLPAPSTRRRQRFEQLFEVSNECKVERLNISPRRYGRRTAGVIVGAVSQTPSCLETQGEPGKTLQESEIIGGQSRFA